MIFFNYDWSIETGSRFSDLNILKIGLGLILLSYMKNYEFLHFTIRRFIYQLSAVVLLFTDNELGIGRNS